MHTNYEVLHGQLRALAAATPDFGLRGSLDADSHRWLGQAYALVSQVLPTEAVSFKVSADNLMGSLRETNSHAVVAAVYRALAVAEQHVPAAARGGFVAVGNAFDFFASMAAIFQQATRDVLILDPYLDATVLISLAPSVPDGILIRLLADREHLQPNLKPALESWRIQHTTRPVECKVTRRKALHDRLVVIDGTTAWDLSQSIKNFAQRSPGSISKCDAEQGPLKIRHYEADWSHPESAAL